MFSLDIRIGLIKRVRDHPNADKLYIVEIDLGNEKRQLVAGIKKYYSAEELVGKKVAVLCNLKPAEIRGVTSQGMVLAADDGRTIALLTSNAPIGSRAIPEGEKASDLSSDEISIDEFLENELRIKNGIVFWNNKKLLAAWEELVPDRKVEEGARIR